MSVGRQRTGQRDSSYERPGRRWVCGHLAAGRPCPVGPARRGRCTAPQQSLCEPRREGQRWLCTRPDPFGGACADGPLPDGRCCRPEPEHRPCRPRLSLRARRGRLSVALAVFALGLALVLIDGRIHLRWISPGNLSSPHTAIAGPTATQCGACHGAADGHPHRWLRLSFAAPAQADSERCLDCHFGSLGPGQARLDHSVPTAALAGFDGSQIDHPRHWLAAAWGPPERAPAGLACARCHQEHRGREADITALDDVRCQACHAARIGAFAQDHPALTAPVKSPSLAFDHVQHRPFWPDEQLACADCHALAADGRAMTTGGYPTCAGCHGQGQDDYHGYAIKRSAHTVLQPPDMEVGPDTPWPGGSGVTLSPLMWLLLAGDDEALAALEDLYLSDDLGLDSEPFEWYPDDDALKDEFARAFRRLLDDLADASADALAARLEAMSGGDASIDALVEQLLAGQFALSAYRARWDQENSDLDRARRRRVPRPAGGSIRSRRRSRTARAVTPIRCRAHGSSSWVPRQGRRRGSGGACGATCARPCSSPAAGCTRPASGATGRRPYPLERPGGCTSMPVRRTRATSNSPTAAISTFAAAARTAARAMCSARKAAPTGVSHRTIGIAAAIATALDSRRTIACTATTTTSCGPSVLFGKFATYQRATQGLGQGAVRREWPVLAKNRNAAQGLVRRARRERAGTPNTALCPLAISTYYLRSTPCIWRSCAL